MDPLLVAGIEKSITGGKLSISGMFGHGAIAKTLTYG